MNMHAYRELLNLLMVSDSDPLEVEALKTFADEEAGRRGFEGGWVVAYHSSQSRGTGRSSGPPVLGDIRLTSVGQHGVEVHVEVDGEWRRAIREHHDCTGGIIDHFVACDGEKPRAWGRVPQ